MKVQLNAKKMLGLRIADSGARAGNKNGGYVPPAAMAGTKGGYVPPNGVG